MSHIKHFLNEALNIKSNKNNLNQGVGFKQNKTKVMNNTKTIEGLTCRIGNKVDSLGYKISNPIREGSNIYDFNDNDGKIECDEGVSSSINGTISKNADNVCEFSGCELNYETLISESLIKLTEINKNLDVEAKKYEGKNQYNVKDKKGNVYFLNYDGEYYKYENSIGDSTFKPNHVNFNETCPKHIAKHIDSSPVFLKANIDPVAGDMCKASKSSKYNILFAKKKELERKIKELKFLKQEKADNDNTGDNATGLVFKRNKKAIELSHKLQIQDELIKKKKYYTDKINSIDTSRGEFIKSIGALQIQYAALGVSSIVMVYLIIKSLSK